uniref:G-protein coupled receptors family 1 profile domain-containing protein n=1 Tax=Timema monikensis TaxID=170555 RepID=A0A7R9HNX7_9NEOP|nr:unnamed protein product [Timema monikensis]
MQRELEDHSLGKAPDDYYHTMNDSSDYWWVGPSNWSNSTLWNDSSSLGNFSVKGEEDWERWTHMAQDRAALFILLIVFSITTVFGNTLVILAVVRERYLHTATNYFVTSLAVADCLVGLVVMPFSAVYEVLENTWFFGSDWCDVWRSLDVLFSTASILNLCVISLDRYWAITDPFTYPMRMSFRRAGLLIAAVWVCSGTISFPAIAWWRAVRTEKVPDMKCPFTENLGYLIFSSTISFYLPLFVMVFTYYRIYRAAVVQTRSLKLGTKQIIMASGELELTLRIHRGGMGNSGGSGDGRPLYQNEDLAPDIEDPITSQQNGLSHHASTRIVANTSTKAMGKNFSLSRKLAKFAKEKKAAKTLGIVMGVFIVCWLPFFVVNLLSGFCTRCIYHEQMVSAVVTWLGWINSSMNPIIYACWSRDFRRSVASLFLCLLLLPQRLKNREAYTMLSLNKPSQLSDGVHDLCGCWVWLLWKFCLFPLFT